MNKKHVLITILMGVFSITQQSISMEKLQQYKKKYAPLLFLDYGTISVEMELRKVMTSEKLDRLVENHKMLKDAVSDENFDAVQTFLNNFELDGRGLIIQDILDNEVDVEEMKKMDTDDLKNMNKIIDLLKKKMPVKK